MLQARCKDGAGSKAELWPEGMTPSAMFTVKAEHTPAQGGRRCSLSRLLSDSSERSASSSLLVQKMMVSHHAHHACMHTHTWPVPVAVRCLRSFLQHSREWAPRNMELCVLSSQLCLLPQRRV